MRLEHLGGRHSSCLHGRSRSVSPLFSLYLGGASSNRRFVSTCGPGTLVLWRLSRASSRSPFSTACRLFVLLAVLAIASMMPWSTIGGMFFPLDTFPAGLGDKAPPWICVKRVSCARFGPQIL